MQKKFETSLEEEEEILNRRVSILEDGKNIFVEYECYKEHKLKISNIEKSITNASKVKNV